MTSLAKRNEKLLAYSRMEAGMPAWMWGVASQGCGGVYAFEAEIKGMSRRDRIGGTIRHKLDVVIIARPEVCNHIGPSASRRWIA